ncbi:hypothetical protein BGZ94_001700 [Podila epigama]|nr:hypothetical protein BGZ94_001700 [Podila epigama]
MAPMATKSCSILLLKENPSAERDPTSTPPLNNASGFSKSTSGPSIDSEERKNNDPYRAALKNTLGSEGEDVQYLAPLTTLYPKDTALSNRIMAGYPSYDDDDDDDDADGHVDHEDDSHRCEKDAKRLLPEVWAFVFTSQNAVLATKEALAMQPDSDIRSSWLNLPVYCLSGATLSAVRQAGFNNINTLTGPEGFKAKKDNDTTNATELVFDNAAQLADFLTSPACPWPKAVKQQQQHCASSSCILPPLPQLWFLTGEVRMKTIGEKLASLQRPELFKEVVVYVTGLRPGFEDELEQYLVITCNSSSSSSSSSSSIQPHAFTSPVTSTTMTYPDQRTLWVVGFSPRGVDLVIPVLKRFLASYGSDTSLAQHATLPHIYLRWAAIGPTTAKHIDSLLNNQQLLSKLPHHRFSICPVVTIAKSPTPDSLATCIANT